MGSKVRELILVLDNIRSTYNVGAILRTAEGFGVRRVVLSGYTPRFNDDSMLPHLREKMQRQIHKTALGAEEMLDIYASGDILVDLKKWHEQGYQIVGLENNLEKPTILLNATELREKLTDQIVLVLGEEVYGIDYALHDIIDLFVEIPMRGRKESFNVSVAAGIALYAMMCEQQQ